MQRHCKHQAGIMKFVSLTFLLIWIAESGSTEMSANELLLCVNLADYPKIWIYTQCIGRVLYAYDNTQLLLHQPMSTTLFTKRTPPRVMNTKNADRSRIIGPQENLPKSWCLWHVLPPKSHINAALPQDCRTTEHVKIHEQLIYMFR